jgi:hypothetical protein
MLDKKYRLAYLPLFYEELDAKITYIAESFEPYHSVRERRYTYYRIYVDNYTIYYVIIDDNPDDLIMEVRHFLYNGQNRKKMV